MNLAADIRKLVDATPFVDTHEHLLEETARLHPESSAYPWQSSRDFSVLLSHYADDDLVVAGMPPEALKTLQDPHALPRDKWRAVEPYYARTRHTGYLQAVRHAVQVLYGVDDLTAETCETVSAKIAGAIRPGYYRHILKDMARLHHCQVHSLEAQVFQDTQYPDLLCQDISTVALATNPRPAQVRAITGQTIQGLEDWHRAIDWCFATYGPRAIATKDNWAYHRGLDYADVTASQAAAPFERLLRDGVGALPPAELKAVQDHLFHYCVRRATDYRLPVKLHTGYYAGRGRMPLNRLRHNAGEMSELLRMHPRTPFVIMHITWPYQDEAIALAKHFANAYVDLCWAWIINPAAGVRFVKEFLMAAPASKLLTFGGDYMPVELVPGHAVVARQGLAQALTELVTEGWLAEGDVPALAERLMFRNALELFDYERASGR